MQNEAPTPLISIVMPVYNREQYVAEAIESILCQRYAPLELIIVDDGSTDSSAAIIQQFEPRLTYLYQENGGISSARNTGIAHATGEFLAFLDSDDVWMPDKLQKQMAVFSADPSTHVVFGHVEQFFDATIDAAFQAGIGNKVGIMPAPLASAMLLRRTTFDAVGDYNVNLSVATDPDWYMRLQELNPNMVMLPDVVYKRRIHRNNTTFTKRVAIRQEYLRTLRAGIQRRRNNNQP